MRLSDRIQCRICGRQFGSLVTHLTRFHHVPPEEYKRQYGVRKVVSERARFKISRRAVARGWGKTAWTEQRVIRAIRRIVKSGGSLAHADLRSHPVAWAAVHHFGSWAKAVAAAGQDYDAFRRIAQPGYWSKARVLEEIAGLHAEGADLSPRALLKTHSELYNAGAVYCGNWGQALRTLGIDPRTCYVRPREMWTRERVLKAIRAEHAAGRSLAPSDVHRRLPSLHNAVNSLFPGAWRTALAEAGLDPDAFLRQERWSQERVVEELLAEASQGHDLSWSGARERSPKLTRAARGKFGTWAAALEAAGIDPEPYMKHRRWSKERVIASIQARIGGGEGVRSSHVNREDPALWGAASRWFGKWSAALKAAGLDGAATGGSQVEGAKAPAAPNRSDIAPPPAPPGPPQG